MRNGVVQVHGVSRWSNNFTNYLLIDFPHLKVVCEQDTAHLGFLVTIQSELFCGDKVEYRTTLIFVSMLGLFVLVCTFYVYTKLSTFRTETFGDVDALFSAYKPSGDKTESIFMPTSQIPRLARTFMRSKFHAKEL